MATAKDIARLAGVSTATVSNVLNRKPGAAGPAKTREILELAQSLHYQPNAFAKNLKKQKTDSIGVLRVHHRREQERHRPHLRGG